MLYRNSLAASIAAFLIFGCSTTSRDEIQKGSSTALVKPTPNQIKQSRGITDVNCERFNPSASGQRAFYGIEISKYEPRVIGFFYCNSISPAKRDGILIGDLITKVRGCETPTTSDVMSIIQDTPSKSVVFIELVRNNSRVVVSLKTISHTPIFPKLPSRDISAQTCNAD